MHHPFAVSVEPAAYAPPFITHTLATPQASPLLRARMGRPPDEGDDDAIAYTGVVDDASKRLHTLHSHMLVPPVSMDRLSNCSDTVSARAQHVVVHK
jgi:hypothetical protein